MPSYRHLQTLIVTRLQKYQFHNSHTINKHRRSELLTELALQPRNDNIMVTQFSQQQQQKLAENQSSINQRNN